MPKLTYEDSIRILLEGVSGANANRLEQEAQVSRQSIARFLNGKTIGNELVDKIGLVVWRKINANILLSPSDLEGPSN